jgi:hypothetical protein
VLQDHDPRYPIVLGFDHQEFYFNRHGRNALRYFLTLVIPVLGIRIGRFTGNVSRCRIDDELKSHWRHSPLPDRQPSFSSHHLVTNIRQTPKKFQKASLLIVFAGTVSHGRTEA